VWEVGTDAEESAAELRVVQIKVVLLDEAVLEVDVRFDLAFLRDSNARVFAAFENDAYAEWLGMVLKVSVGPVLAAFFLEIVGPNDRKVMLGGKLLDSLMVLPRHGAKNLTVNVLLPLVAEEADDIHRDLQELHDHVDEHTIKATVVHADGVLMVLHKGVHGGPPRMGW
jgi:hypothetical protein